METGFVVKHLSGMYLADLEQHWNSHPDYAMRFPSLEEAQAVADKIQAFVSVEAAGEDA